MTNDEIRLRIAELRGWTFVDTKAFIGCKDKSGLSAFEECPNWPVDIAAAWELVEEMKQIGGAVCVEWTIESMNAPFKWWCGVNVPQDYELRPFTSKWHSGRDGTAPRAICLAYIAWKEAQA